MVFGAMSCGQAQQFGPDLGKARRAAERIFEILDYQEVSVVQIQQEDESNQVGQILENRQVAIEFKNVWFKYPTRETEWVLKDLNLKIF